MSYLSIDTTTEKLIPKLLLSKKIPEKQSKSYIIQ